MKKLFWLLLAAFILAGCGESSSAIKTESTTYINEDGNSTYESSRGTRITYDSLPGKVDYNGVPITLTDVSAYEIKSDESYSYTLYVVARVDVSQLSDEQIHWLREEDIDMRIYLTSEQNGYDFDTLSQLGSLFITDLHYIDFVYMTSVLDSNRNSFGGSELSVSLDVTQEKTYVFTNDDGKENDLHKVNSISYHYDIPDSVPSSGEIEEPLGSQIAEWLYDRAEYWANMS